MLASTKKTLTHLKLTNTDVLKKITKDELFNELSKKFQKFSGEFYIW